MAPLEVLSAPIFLRCPTPHHAPPHPHPRVPSWSQSRVYHLCLFFIRFLVPPPLCAAIRFFSPPILLLPVAAAVPLPAPDRIVFSSILSKVPASFRPLGSFGCSSSVRSISSWPKADERWASCCRPAFGRLFLPGVASPSLFSRTACVFFLGRWSALRSLRLLGGSLLFLHKVLLSTGPAAPPAAFQQLSPELQPIVKVHAINRVNFRLPSPRSL